MCEGESAIYDNSRPRRARYIVLRKRTEFLGEGPDWSGGGVKPIESEVLEHHLQRASHELVHVEQRL